MDTWWLRTEAALLKHASSTIGSSDDGSSETGTGTNADYTESGNMDFSATVDKKTQRMVDWTCELLLSNLKAVVADRSAQSTVSATKKSFMSAEMSAELMTGGQIPMDEFRNNLAFPASPTTDSSNVELGAKVVAQMRNFVTVIASMYRTTNAFHNFEHASHVTMSAVSVKFANVTHDPFRSTH